MSNNDGPSVTTSSQSWYKPVRPGNKSYSEALNDSKKSVIFSTSMTKGIRPDRFNRENYTHGKASFHRFHGGKARQIRNQIETHLQEELPDAAILLIGGNDLSDNRNNPTPVVNIANQIIDSAILCKKYGVKDVCVSSVLMRKERNTNFELTERRRKELNENLRSLCDINNFIFLDNDVGEGKIVLEHTYDGVHLNDPGSELLGRKFGFILNELHSN